MTLFTAFIDLAVEVADYLATDPVFTDIATPTLSVPVLARHKKDLTNELQHQINKLAVCGFVTVTQAGVNFPNADGPVFDDVELQVGFCENRLLNKTGKTAELLAAYAAKILHHWKPASASSPLMCGKDNRGNLTYVEIPPESASDAAKRLVALRLFTTLVFPNYRPATVETPVITDVGNGTFHIECATPDAIIYFTQDGMLPTNARGTLWAGVDVPYADPMPGVIAARGYRIGSRASAVGKLFTGALLATEGDIVITDEFDRPLEGKII